MTELTWTYTHFNDLTATDLYQFLWLRSRVFVVEQNCVYLDLDHKDQHCWHLCGWINNEPAAYARIIPPGICYTEASIGRVVSNPDYRREGFGRQLMELAIEKTLEQFNVTQIRIGAQLYLLQFYQSLQFLPTGEQYLEDGIPHIEMIYTK